MIKKHEISDAGTGTLVEESQTFKALSKLLELRGLS